MFKSLLRSRRFLSARPTTRNRAQGVHRRRLRLEALESRQLLFADTHADELFCGSLDSFPPPSESSLEIVSANAVSESSSALAAVTAPGHSSLPGAAASLFLDFDGHFEASWGGYSNITTPAFDLDGDPSTFNAAESAAIFEVWSRVAEDFAPFNLNVTTVDPGIVANRVVAVIAIGGSNSDWYGSSAGGVAYVGGFFNSSPNVGYVFENNQSGNANYIAVAAAQEAGHV